MFIKKTNISYRNFDMCLPPQIDENVKIKSIDFHTTSYQVMLYVGKVVYYFENNHSGGITQ